MTVTGLIITWILFGLLAGAIGASRNVGFLFHAMIGFMFGPIGVLTALLFKPTEDDTYKRKGESSGLVKCPFCAELVKAEAKVCKHCHSDLSSSSTSEKTKSTGSEIYRLYQIEIFPEHCEVNGQKFDSLSEAKAWIDAQ